jgi:dienelactone hydrolase
LSPAGELAYPAVLLLPGCSGFATTNGTNIYDERGADLQAAGYLVVFVDYIGRRLQNNCAHVSQSEVSTDILEAGESLHAPKPFSLGNTLLQISRDNGLENNRPRSI